MAPRRTEELRSLTIDDTRVDAACPITMIRSRLSSKLFASAVTVFAALTLAIYAFSVPLIKDTAFDLEERAGRAVLDTVYELTNRIYLDLESHRSLALETHRQRLQNMVDLADSYINSVHRQVEDGQLSLEDGRQLLYDTLRGFRYGNNDYFWAADYDANIVSHPDPELQGENMADQLDDAGLSLIQRMMQMARRDGGGYYRHSLRRLGDDEPTPKLTYFRDFPEWGFVLGTGVYLDDVEADVQRRETVAINDLRRALREITIGKTGYLYIFDSSYKMVIHPNPNIESTYFGELVDPISRRPIGSELVKVADSDNGRFYLWDRPEDPGHYVYEKISWVRHFKGFDWYIASSVYVDELRESSEVLGHRILYISLSFLMLSILLSYLFARHISAPVKRLAATARRIQGGDLTARSGIQQADEIGVLSTAFDGMVVRLQDNIDNLDSNVRERTAELQHTVNWLEQAQADLAQSEHRQRVILDAIPTNVALLDESDCIRFVNRSYAELLEADKSALIGSPLPDLIDWNGNKELMAHLIQAHDGQVQHFTQHWTSGDSLARLMSTTLIPELEESGESPGILVLTRDITEEKETEKRLLEMQRMGAVAQLAGGLAHDFNNLLSIIIGNLASAREQFPEVSGLTECLDPAIRASRRGADITGRLLAFARSQPLTPSAVDAAVLMRETSTLLSHSLPGNIQVVMEVTEGSHFAYVDAGQLENALINLVLNARDVMPEGGRIVLRLSCRTISSEDASDALAAGEYLAMSVSDSGPGFAEGAQARAFEPFFTTKRGRGGSGLGLSMVYGFVKQSGGQVDIESIPGKGSTVTLLLPVASPAQQDDITVPLTGKVVAGEWSGKLAILVEDEAELRILVRRQLTEMGFVVLECASADEAAPLALSTGELFLMVVDVMTPGTLDGFALADKLLNERPNTLVVLMTGYVDDQALAARNERRLGVLRKPFDKEELRAAIALAQNVVSTRERG